MSLSFWSELSGLERTQLRHLALIRPQSPSSSQVRFLEGLCQTLRSPRLLALIARTPHWLSQGEVLTLLAENPCTPASLRKELQQAMSVITLLRDLDNTAKDDRAQLEAVVRKAFKATPSELQPVTRAISRQLASGPKTLLPGQEGPALPAASPDWEVLMGLPPGEEQPPIVAVDRDPGQRASSPQTWEDTREPPAPAIKPQAFSRDQHKLLDRLWGDDADLRQNALTSPILTQELLIASLPSCPNPEAMEEIYLEPRWHFREAVRAAIHQAPGCPPGVMKRMDAANRLLEGITTDAEEDIGIDRIQNLLTQLEEPEYLYVVFKIRANHPHLLDVIKKSYLEREHRLQSPPAEAEARWDALNERAEVARLVFL